jgi:hypothetical protein
MKAKNYLSILFATLAICFKLEAQSVGINADGSAPHLSSILDVKSTSKGLLMPRMTSAQRTGIVSPATALTVFDTQTNSYWYYKAGAWTELKGFALPLEESANVSYSALQINNNHSTGTAITGASEEGGIGVYGASFQGYGGFFSTVSNIYALKTQGGAQVNGRLDVKDSSVVFTAPNTHSGANNFKDTPVTGNGARLMWYADKAAFRAGEVGSTSVEPGSPTVWNKENIGIGSVAMGFGTEASGVGSMAIGGLSKASGAHSVAMGYKSVAKSALSFAMGNFAEATYEGAIAFGGQTHATGYYSMATGLFSWASGTLSTAMGVASKARSLGELAVGVFCTDYVSSADSARLFVVGDGTEVVQHDAFTVVKSGHVGVGFGVGTSAINTYNFSVNGSAAKPGSNTWTITSDARTKKNIERYRSGLKEVLAINPVRFQYNELSGYADTTSRYVGVLAQEIEKVLPSAVSIVKNDHLVKDKLVYDGNELVYTLINAIKELSEANTALNARVLALEEVSARNASVRQAQIVGREASTPIVMVNQDAPRP